MKNILIINGPNLKLLGKRETDIYGQESWEKRFLDIKTEFAGTQLGYFQGNYEGEIVSAIQQAGEMYDGIVLNAGAYTHTSVALRDAIAACDIPVVEVHISKPTTREYFRKTSLISDVCAGVISGFGTESYKLAIYYLINQK